MDQKPLKCWALVELMGHQRIAGEIEERAFGSTVMLQVNVPETLELPAFTRLLSFSAIYAINPCEEEVARHAAASIREMPILNYDMAVHVKHKLNGLIEAGKYVLAGNVESGYPQDVDENPGFDDDGDDDNMGF